MEDFFIFALHNFREFRHIERIVVNVWHFNVYDGNLQFIELVQIIIILWALLFVTWARCSTHFECISVCDVWVDRLPVLLLPKYPFATNKLYFVRLAMIHLPLDHRQNSLRLFLWPFAKCDRNQYYWCWSIPRRNSHLYCTRKKKEHVYGQFLLLQIKKSKFFRHRVAENMYLNSLSSISGNVRYSSSTKSTNDDLVVFKTRNSFRPLMIVGRASVNERKEKKQSKININISLSGWIPYLAFLFFPSVLLAYESRTTFTSSRRAHWLQPLSVIFYFN